MTKLPTLLLAIFLCSCSGFHSDSSPAPPSQASPNPINQNPGQLKSAWVSGSSRVHQQGNFGTLGIPSPAVFPGSRSWMAAAGDNSGNLWVFGGEGLDGTLGAGDLNDLWMFSTSTQMWTWVSGSSSAGQTTSASGPGARHGAVAWTDLSGNFWIFGGNSGGIDLNELWKFSPQTNTWTQLSSTAAVPSRIWATSWTDSSGNLWLFGGQAQTIVNDLWKYSPSTNQWTLVSGTSSTFAAGVYGTKGVASAANAPGARRDAVGWADAQGNLWLFGGDGVDSFGKIGFLNDLWKFDTAKGLWTWVSGPSASSSPAFYGYPGISSPYTIPGARSSAYTWVDKSGRLWLLGGIGRDGTNNTNLAALNDLWQFSPQTGQWTWMAGSNMGNQGGQYGNLGGLGPVNFPGARKLGASWVDTKGNFWLFGGMGFDSQSRFQDMNDVWVIQF